MVVVRMVMLRLLIMSSDACRSCLSWAVVVVVAVVVGLGCGIRTLCGVRCVLSVGDVLTVCNCLLAHCFPAGAGESVYT